MRFIFNYYFTYFYVILGKTLGYSRPNFFTEKILVNQNFRKKKRHYVIVMSTFTSDILLLIDVFMSNVCKKEKWKNKLKLLNKEMSVFVSLFPN